jgi:hypothetical protein
MYTCLAINGKIWMNERSDWAFSKMIIWDQALNKDEIKMVSSAFSALLSPKQAKEIVIVSGVPGTSSTLNGYPITTGIYAVESTVGPPKVLSIAPKTFTVMYIDLNNQSILSTHITPCSNSNELLKALLEDMSMVSNYLMIFLTNDATLTNMPKAIYQRLSKCGGTRRKFKGDGGNYVLIGQCSKDINNNNNNNKILSDGYDIRLKGNDKKVLKLLLQDGTYSITI